MSVKSRVIFIPVAAFIGALAGIIIAERFAHLPLLLAIAIALATVLVFDWILILTLPQIWSEKELRKILILLLLPASFIAIGLAGVCYRQTFWYGIGFFVVGLILSRTLKKRIRKGLDRLREVLKERAPDKIEG